MATTTTNNNNSLEYLKNIQILLKEEINNTNNIILKVENRINDYNKDILDNNKSNIKNEVEIKKLEDQIKELENKIKEEKEITGIDDEDADENYKVMGYRNEIQTIDDELYQYKQNALFNQSRLDFSADFKTENMQFKLKLTNYTTKCKSLLEDIDNILELEETCKKEDIQKQLASLNNIFKEIISTSHRYRNETNKLDKYLNQK